jgi:hypothetical protein
VTVCVGTLFQWNYANVGLPVAVPLGSTRRVADDCSLLMSVERLDRRIDVENIAQDS